MEVSAFLNYKFSAPTRNYLNTEEPTGDNHLNRELSTAYFPFKFQITSIYMTTRTFYFQTFHERAELFFFDTQYVILNRTKMVQQQF